MEFMWAISILLHELSDNVWRQIDNNLFWKKELYLMWRYIFRRCEACAEAWGRHFENFCEIKYVEQQKKTDSKFPTDAGLLRDKLRDICRFRGHNKTDALYNHVCYKIIHSPSYFAKALLSSRTYHPKVVIKILKRNIHWLHVLKFGNKF